MTKKMIKNTFVLLIYGLLQFGLLQAQDTAIVKLDFQNRNTVIEAFCEILNDNYVYPEKAINMCKLLRDNNINNKYDTLTNPNSFSQQLNIDLRSLYTDKHLRVAYDPQLEKDINEYNASKTGKTKILNDENLEDQRKNYYFKRVEIFPSNIGYLEFTNFAKLNQSASKTIHAAMQFVSHTDALIIDLRNNHGGNPETASEILSYFFEGKNKIGRSYNRMNNKWTDNFIVNKKCITKGIVLKMPIYILTSNETYSAAEGFSYTLQHIKNATIIGDKTRGGAHLARSFSLGCGFVCFVPYSRTENIVTQTDWEETGVIPNIQVEDDKCLSTAKAMILESKLNTAKSDTERNQIKYLLNYYKSKNTYWIPDPSVISKFVGEYEYFEVTVKDNELLFMDKKNYNTPEKMVAITNTLYQVKSDYQIEFMLDENGFCNSFKMYWDDGYEEVVFKNNR